MRLTKIILSVVVLVFGLFTQSFCQSNVDWQAKVSELSSNLNELSASDQYNLGTAYLQSGNLGKARLHLEKAYLLDPWDRDINNNLTITKDKIASDIIELPPFFLTRWINKISLSLSSITWAILSLCSLIAIVIFYYFKWITNSTSPILLKKWPAVIGVILLLKFVLLSLHSYYLVHSSEETIIISSSEMFDEVIGGSMIKKLTPGDKVEIERVDDDWSKVKTMDLESGWIKTDVYEKI